MVHVRFVYLFVGDPCDSVSPFVASSLRLGGRSSPATLGVWPASGGISIGGGVSRAGERGETALSTVSYNHRE